MKKKISVGTWAYVFGPFADNPVPLATICSELGRMGYDGVALAGFKPHAHPDDYSTPELREELKKMLLDNNLEVDEFVPDLWSVNPLLQIDEYFSLYEKNIKFMTEMGFRIIRVDSGTPPILPENMSYDEARTRIVAMFKKCALIAAKEGIEVAWEFEPGFMFNKPSEVKGIVDEVNEPNFKILFDTCHAHMGAVVGARHFGEKEILEGGIVEYCEMLKDKIGVVHLIDSDGTLNQAQTSTHAPFGDGIINFAEVIPAILNKANYKGEWWAIDLCEWPDAWKVTEEVLSYVQKINEEHCK
jgi:sugar phosphate isomerase/epimerase